MVYLDPSCRMALYAPAAVLVVPARMAGRAVGRGRVVRKRERRSGVGERPRCYRLMALLARYPVVRRVVGGLCGVTGRHVAARAARCSGYVRKSPSGSSLMAVLADRPVVSRVARGLNRRAVV